MQLTLSDRFSALPPPRLSGVAAAKAGPTLVLTHHSPAPTRSLQTQFVPASAAAPAAPLTVKPVARPPVKSHTVNLQAVVQHSRILTAAAQKAGRAVSRYASGSTALSEPSGHRSLDPSRNCMF